VPLGIALATALVFLPALRNDFVRWDDEANLLANPAYRGLVWPQIKWMFTTYRPGGHYIPLTWLSFGLDYVVWKLNPVGYHLTNVLLHVAGTVLFFFVARALIVRANTLSGTASVVGAAGAALFFGIHPLRVESVAWATERRDVLSGVFFFATLLFYIAASEAEAPRRRRLLGASSGTYLAALLAKPIVMTLPLVLILLDVYPLRRLSWPPRAWLHPAARRVLIEKLPYLLLGILGTAVSLYAQAHGVPRPPSPALERVANILYSVWFYGVKTVVPVGLAPMYETPAHTSLLAPHFLAAAVGVLGVTALALRYAARWPAGLVALAYYGIVLAPVSGVFFSSYLVADRYSYLPCLGWAVLVGAAIGAVGDEVGRGALAPRVGRAAAAAAVAGFLGLAALTSQQVQFWHDTESLWRRAVAVDPGCALCHVFLGDTLLDRGATISALPHFERAVALRPDRLDYRIRLAAALGALGAWQEAADELQTVLARAPNDVGTRNDLAVALLQVGRPADAVAVLEPAVRRAPDHPGPHATLGLALSELGRHDAAVEQFRRAIELRPGLSAARLGLMRAYVALGRADLAREQYEALLTLDSRLVADLPRP
jgi:tetratricopeptide (TPR) repeat protein